MRGEPNKIRSVTACCEDTRHFTDCDTPNLVHDMEHVLEMLLYTAKDITFAQHTQDITLVAPQVDDSGFYLLSQ